MTWRAWSLLFAVACSPTPSPEPAASVPAFAAQSSRPATAREPEPRRIAVGRDAACALTGSDDLICWGAWRDWVAPPKISAALKPVAQVSMTALDKRHVCVLSRAGQVQCWREQEEGWEPTRAVPDGAVDVTAGTEHACAAMADGTVNCWGANHAAQLGDGTLAQSSGTVAVPGIDDAIAVRANTACCEAFTCAVRRSGQVWCWGANSVKSDPRRKKPSQVPGIEDAVRFETGARLCVSRRSGPAVCIQPAPHLVEDYMPVIPLGDTEGATAVGAGEHHLCVRGADDHVRCRGANRIGELGVGDLEPRTELAAVVGLGPVAELSTHETQACARRADGSVWCWGGRYRRPSSPTARATPARVSKLPPAREVVCGDVGCCARTTNDEAWCWGGSQLAFGGLRDRPAWTGKPQRMPVDEVVALSAGGGVCARTRDAKLVCWAVEHRAPRSTKNALVGVEAQGLVAVGRWSACAANARGVIHCVGEPRWRDPSHCLSRPEGSWALGHLDKARAFDMTEWLVCGIGADRRPACWGTRNVTRGMGVVSASPTPACGQLLDMPTTLPPARRFDRIAVGDHFVCTVDTTGDPWCWGVNNRGQLGRGAATKFEGAAAVQGLSNIVAIDASTHACAVDDKGVVKCWGSNAYGELGDGIARPPVSPNERQERFVASPQRVKGIPPMVGVAAGLHTSCAWTADGAVYCWGRNDKGQLGLGDEVPQHVRPVRIEGIAPR